MEMEMRQTVQYNKVSLRNNVHRYLTIHTCKIWHINSIIVGNMNIVFQQVKVNMENLQKEIGCSLLTRSQSHYCNDIFFYEWNWNRNLFIIMNAMDLSHLNGRSCSGGPNCSKSVPGNPNIKMHTPPVRPLLLLDIIVIEGCSSSHRLSSLLSLKCPTPPPFITLALTKASSSKDDDSISSVSANSG